MGFKEELREALIDAFPCTMDLEIMLSDQLEWKLNQIAGGENYKHIVYKVINYADSQGELIELIKAAKRANPGNHKLQTIDLNRQEIQPLEKKNLLYEALLSLNYQEQLNKFQEFWNLDINRPAGCFLVRGAPASCQRWLLNRLLQKSLPYNTKAKKVWISLAEREESYIEDIWAKLSRELETSASPQKLVTRVYEYWQNETVIIVFPNFDRLCPTEANQLIEEFWNPLVENVQQCSQRCDYYLVMFLVDNRGYAPKWGIHCTTDINEYKPSHPVDLQPISNFSQNLLSQWVMYNRQLLDAFLRRCIFHYLEFPSKEELIEIVKVHFQDKQLPFSIELLVDEFLEVRDKTDKNSGKQVSTSELIDWIKALVLSFSPGEIRKKLEQKEIPFLGVLLKTRDEKIRYQKQRHDTK